MTREEEIRQEIDLRLSGSFGNYFEGYEEGFIEGAKWADENPNSNGKELLYVAQKTAERTKKEFISKACEWLLKGGYFVNNTETINDFKKSNGIMKRWLARNKSGSLFMYSSRPELVCDGFYFGSGQSLLDSELFPEVTFDNSPQEVELKLCHQTETIKIADCNPKAQPCVLTNHGIDTNVVKFD